MTKNLVLLLVFIAIVVSSAGCTDKKSVEQKDISDVSYQKADIKSPSGIVYFTAYSPKGIISVLPNASLPSEDGIWQVSAMDNMSFQGTISLKDLNETIPDITFDFGNKGESRLRNLHLVSIGKKTDSSIREDYDSTKDILGTDEYSLVADDNAGVKSISVGILQKETRQSYGGGFEADWQNNPLMLYSPDIKLSQEDIAQGKTIIVTVYGEY